uniref:Ion transport domain-containing protein n=1 Tax=Anabas testudineus TaxID=64144 RepID=A0A7N6ARA4_ANATE
MISEECPVPLGSISSAVPGQSEEYSSAQADDIIEEVGPGDDVSIGSDLSTLVVPFPELAPVVFFCLKQTTCPRNWCIRMVSSPYPLTISIMVILLNCVTLGMYQPCENIDCTSDRCQILQAFDAFIYIFFALEMVVKMVALGIFGRRCYLGDTWNRLDFFIVMAGMVEYSLDLQNINLSAIRTVRVLRPLKAINRVPSMRILVNLLLDTLPMLGNVLLLCFFVFFIFGIIGVQLWAGLLRNRCYLEENFTLSSGMTLPPPYYQPEEDDERPFICSLPSDNGIMSCSDVPARREGGRTCCLDREDALHRQALGLSPEPLANGSGAGEAMGLCINWNQYYTRCHTGNSNPHKGAINFDNIVYAWIVIFQVITLEGWVEIMYYVMDAHSFYNFIYFILLIIIGSFFMINLCLVVIATQFSETKQREHQLMQEQRAQCLSSSTLASMTEPGDCYEEIFQLVCHVLRKAKRRSAALYYTLRGKPPPAGGGRGNRRSGGGNVNGERHHSRHPRCCLYFYLCISPATHCPHQSKQDHSSEPLSNSISLSVPQNPEDCPICALSLKEGARAVGDGVEDEENSVKETGKEENHLEERAEGEKKRRRTCFGHCRDIWNDMRRKLWGIVESKYFSRGIMIAILINTISMGIEHHNQPEELTNVLEICNIVFTSMFTLEMILKLTAFGFFEYLRNPYNIFDGIIVIISVCEIIGQSDGGLSVLRTFRLLRVIKLVRFMPALRRQLVVLMKTMDNVATFCMLLMLFIFIFSILGMHIFGCKFSLKTEAGDTVPDRKNFDSLLWAIVTVFQILTQEDWNMVLYNGMASTSPCAALYFVALMTFGNYVLFNLLVAILVEGFQAEGDANRSYSDDDRSSCNFEENDKQKDSLHLSGITDPKICTLTPNGHLDLSPLSAGLFSGERLTLALGSRKNSVISLGKANLEQRAIVSRGYHNWGRPLPPQPQALWARRSSWNSLGGENPCSSSSPSGSPAFTPTSARPFYGYGLGGLGGVVGGSLRIRGPRASSSPHRHLYHAHDVCLYVYFLQSLCFRIQKMLEAYRPDWLSVLPHFTFFLVSLIAPSPLSDCEFPSLSPVCWIQERVFLTISNYIFTAIFVGEMTLKVVSMGLYMGEQAYLRSSWNILDGFLVFVSLIDIVVSMAGGAKILGVLRVLRLLRTLRPLRVISRAPGLKLVVETLITSLKPIGNIVLICCAFFIIFGILGVQLFKGKFFYCFGPDVKNITNKSDCLQANYKWVHHKYNFDNLGQALMSLFVLASKDGWVNIMYHGLDAVGVDQQPVTNNNPWMLLYFISFLLIVSFFVLNMFVGVVVENFHKCRQHQEVEEAKRREEKRQRRMEKKRRKAHKLPYYASYGHMRLMIHTLCTNHYLDLIITFIICINVITMSLEHYNQPHSLDLALKYCNYFFTSTFVLEAVLKLIAFGVRRFFKDRWNQLDLAIVLLSVMGITLEEIEISAALPINPTIIRIMRVLRIARVLKLLKMATGMRALLDTVVQALPQVGNLGLLFMLLFFIYAALGVELFGELVCNEDYPCEGMSRHATFENFGMAFLTLFQVSTGDNWNGIMKDTLRECPPDHNTDVDYACNPSLQFISPMYFVSFVLTAQFVLINVVVAVLMKHLDDSNKEAQEEAEMDAEIELELAQGTLCCMGAPGCGGGGVDKGLAAAGAGPGGTAGGKERGGARGEMGLRKMRHTAATESQWLDSVSLLIKDTLEGEMLIIDNLSGSVFHHYSSPPPICKDCKGHPQEIRMAEIEQASLKSEQLSDKSSSPALPDDLSLDEHTAYQLLLREGKVGMSRYPSHSDSSIATGSSEGSLQTTLEEGLSFSISPPQNLQLPTAPLQIVCPLPLPEDSTSLSSPVQTLKPRPTPSSALTLQATRGHQRSQSSGRGSTSPGYTRDDSIDPSDEDLGIGIGSSIGGCGSSQAGNSEHLSETLSSLSLTSLLSPSSLVYPGGAVKKCNSTGSLDQGGILLSSRGREGRREILGLELMDPQGLLANPWTGVLVDTKREGRDEIADGEQRFKGKSSSQTTVGPCRKNR